MRSMTDDALTGRCTRCWIRRGHCVCAHVPRLDTRAELLVIRHRKEAWKSTNTARIAGLALARLVLEEYVADRGSDHASLAPLLAGDGVALVYPAEPRAEWPAVPPRRLVFLDGTWRQTRRMVRRIPALAALPRLWLAPGPQHDAVTRLREPSLPGGRSTLESIADALRATGEGDAATALDALHARYVEHVLRARGRRESAVS